MAALEEQDALFSKEVITGNVGVYVVKIVDVVVFKWENEKKTITDHAGCAHDKYQSSLISCTRADALVTRYSGIFPDPS